MHSWAFSPRHQKQYPAAETRTDEPLRPDDNGHFGAMSPRHLRGLGFTPDDRNPPHTINRRWANTAFPRGGPSPADLVFTRFTISAITPFRLVEERDLTAVKPALYDSHGRAIRSFYWRKTHV